MTHYIDPLQDDDLREAYDRLARHLTGKVVLVWFTKPLAKNATGESYLDENGISRVNIAPGVSVQKSYEILLHEAAHIRLNHVSPVKVTPLRYQLTALLDAAQSNAQPENKPAHEAANRLADDWYRLGEDTIAKSLRLGTTEKQRALMNTNALLSTKWIGAK